jgi:hypothetical protein
MNNKAMERAIEFGTCRDIAGSARIGPYYVIDDFDPDLDYADASAELWVWSIGYAERHLPFAWLGSTYIVPSGTVIASLDNDLYQRDGLHCLWLR